MEHPLYTSHCLVLRVQKRARQTKPPASLALALGPLGTRHIVEGIFSFKTFWVLTGDSIYSREALTDFCMGEAGRERLLTGIRGSKEKE